MCKYWAMGIADLESDHHSIDALLEEFVSGLEQGVWAELFLEAARDLRLHIYVEELYLFPPLRAAGMLPPVLVMLREHGQMWTVLDEIQRTLAAPDVAELRRLCDILTGMIGAHNDKEEAILYPAAAEVLDPQTQEDIANALVDETVPEGWRCEMAA